nr:reverse transcriptase domain-containing protein [Tanacetum cinerariifolium]
MDDEPMWAADHVVAPTPGSAVTIPETTNEFVIKGNHLTLVKGNQFDELVEVFMDDFFVFGNSFESCLNNLDKMLQHCRDAHLVLNWENIISWTRKELCLDTSGTDLATAAGTDLATPAGTDLATAAADQATAARTDLATAAGTDLAIAAGTDLATAAGTDLATAAGTDLANHSGTDLANHFGTRS